MKLLNVDVHNVLKVSDAKLNTEGHHLFLVGGKNANGKSSALKAVVCALCGKRELGSDWPDMLLKDGEDRGWVKLSLSGDEELHDAEGFTVELLLRRKRGGVVAEEFRVLDSTGEEAAEPRALLKTLYAFRGFDPLSFERSKPKDRAELLRDLVGLDFTELEEKRKSIYTQRTVINTEGKNKKAQLDSIEVPDGTPDESMSVAELFSRLEDAQVTNREIANAKLNTSQELESAKAGAEKLAEEETRLRERLAEVERLRKESEASIPGLEKAAAEAEKMEPIDETEIREQIDSVDQVNRAVEAKKRKAELEEIVKDLRGKSQKMTDEIKSIDQEKQDRLENAKWPLPNLSLDDSGVLLNDLPFEQASKAERVVASVKVGMALNPKLRLLVCEDGNDLDNDTMAALDNVLKENDFQMLLEYVTRSEEDEAQCAVVFHDGELKSATVAHQDDEESGDLFDDK